MLDRQTGADGVNGACRRQHPFARDHSMAAELVTSARTRMALDTLRASRVALWCDPDTMHIAAVTGRSGFTLKGQLRHHGLNNSGGPCDELIISFTSERV